MMERQIGKVLLLLVCDCDATSCERQRDEPSTSLYLGGDSTLDRLIPAASQQSWLGR